MMTSDPGRLFRASTALRTLMRDGFSLEEAERLFLLHERYEQQVEYQERMAAQRRLEFIRWMVETGRISDELPEPSAERAEDDDTGATQAGETANS